MILKFEWDEKKNKRNQKKHGISFEEAIAVFSDPMNYETYDWNHSIFEKRWIKIGLAGGKIIKVVFTERNGTIRIISARKADLNEEEEYFYGYGKKNS